MNNTIAEVPAVQSGACPKEAAVVVISLSVSDRMVQMLTGRSVLTLSTPHVPGMGHIDIVCLQKGDALSSSQHISIMLDNILSLLSLQTIHQI